MLNKEREQEIINILKTSSGFVSVKQLCDMLYASESSIRRDLKSLEKQGLVNRSYGGASFENNISNIATFNLRTQHKTNEKQMIARKALSLIHEGDIVFLDQSSTSFFLAYELMEHKSLTIVTNNIEILMLLSNSKINLISSGGTLSSQNRNCLIGSEAQRTFQNIFADIMFFSVRSISDDGIVTDCANEEIAVRYTMLKNAHKKVLLCDSSKFSSRSPFKQCELGDVDYLISEGSSAQHFSSYQNKITLL